MSRHVLPEGRQMIAGLAHLGRALGYSVEEERPIGESGAAVDLAWYAADDNGVPLMIFEVESNATASMANNAMKVLSRDADDFIKPLFFFHVLLVGGPDNGRIAGLRRQWGSHNYRVYRLNEDAELLRLVCDILAQHRRINKTVDVGNVAEALLTRPWTRLERATVLRALERLKFDANYLGSYALAALDQADLRPEYLRRLKETHDRNDRLDVERYGTYLGDSFPNMLDVAVLVCANLIPEAEAAVRLEEWQTRSRYMRTVGPYFGLSRDYDQYVKGISPFIYGVAGLLVREKWPAYAWLVNDLHSILKEARERWNFGGDLAVPTAVWLAHLASSGMRRAAAAANADGRGQLMQAYRLAIEVLNEHGGLPEAVIDNPPAYVDIWDVEEWQKTLSQPGIRVPEWDSLNARYEKEDLDELWADPIRAAIAIVSGEEWPTWPTRGLLVAMRA